eukprot:2534808-Pyramimonas_sp.AAC.1
MGTYFSVDPNPLRPSPDALGNLLSRLGCSEARKAEDVHITGNLVRKSTTLDRRALRLRFA